MDNTKSSAVSFPLPAPVLNAFSLNVINTAELSSFNSAFVIAGPLLSFNLAEAV